MTYLHHDTASTVGNRNALLVLENNSPDRLGRNQLTNEVACFDIPDLDASVAAATDDSGVVELKTGHAVIVRSESMYGTHLLQRPYSDGAVRATCD